MQFGQLTELRQRCCFVVGRLLVFRIGTFIPVPGVNPAALAVLFDQQQGTILDMFNMFSGGALERASLFALGIMPYISASIIMQLMTAVMPKLEQLKKEGEQGVARSPSTRATELWVWPLSRPSVSPCSCRASRRAGMPW